MTGRLAPPESPQPLRLSQPGLPYDLDISSDDSHRVRPRWWSGMSGSAMRRAHLLLGRRTDSNWVSLPHRFSVTGLTAHSTPILPSSTPVLSMPGQLETSPVCTCSENGRYHGSLATCH